MPSGETSCADARAASSAGRDRAGPPERWSPRSSLDGVRSQGSTWGNASSRRSAPIRARRRVRALDV
ncbi:hypothetical protein DKM19_42505 [Streptosporangium sp. 'caverna']|nr:hypothetical protein DKM19_42505 [Streptosporangium sp. 'caverna']